jgi:NhaA family Na+:H+ antiporter
MRDERSNFQANPTARNIDERKRFVAWYGLASVFSTGIDSGSDLTARCITVYRGIKTLKEGVFMNGKFLRPAVLRSFLAGEAAGGILLIAAAACAIILANADSMAADWYHHFLHWQIAPALSPKLGPTTVHLAINDGLMALFFMLVGLEIKREFLDGRLSSWSQRRLPMIAAAAGMVVPALFYLVIVGREAQLVPGWAIPAATDIAFALGVLALLGKRAPMSLKLLLTTIAIVDDIGAVAIIAFFYTAAIDGVALGAAALILCAMMTLNRMGLKSLIVFLLLSVALWYAVLLSGVHATIAGVLAALTIPIRRTPGAPDAIDSPLHRLEHSLHPWSAFLIVPLFGFANAGVSLRGMDMGALMSPLPLGVAMGLFLGKQIGIFGGIRLAVKAGIASIPRGASWLQIYGTALLCGIGFTMSLFIGGLAFVARDVLIEEAKIGILGGSLLSAIAGFLVLRFAPLHPDHAREEEAQKKEIDDDGDVKS